MLTPNVRDHILCEMINIPPFNAAGDLSPGVYRATLDDIAQRFGNESSGRRILAERLLRIHLLTRGTGHLARFIIFGSFVTAKPAPNDVDVFILMTDSFNADGLSGETAILFSNPAAQAYFGASVFWLRRAALLGNEGDTIEYWQTKRDGTRRGIIEVISDDQLGS
jgi:PAS domain-containing protein